VLLHNCDMSLAIIFNGNWLVGGVSFYSKKLTLNIARFDLQIRNKAVNLELSWHNGHVGHSLAWLPEVPHTLDGLVEEGAKNYEDETKKDTEDWHSTLFRVFS
jgi:hypothetical protein